MVEGLSEVMTPKVILSACSGGLREKPLAQIAHNRISLLLVIIFFAAHLILKSDVIIGLKPPVTPPTP